VTGPAHWTWHGEPIDPGPAVVVDIDGVLADAVNRQHFLDRERPDYQAFFDACGDDPVIEEIRVLLDLLDPDLQVVLLTARPDRVRPLTEAWLRRHEIRWDLLVMRPTGTRELAREFKQESTLMLRSFGFDLRLALEDAPDNVEMFQAIGVPCIYFHSGYYE
jgi:hypothetical protein